VGNILFMEELSPFEQMLCGRRSVRKFRKEALAAADVVRLMRPALLVPSSKGRQPCEFVLVDEPERLRRLSECRRAGAAFLSEAPLAVAVCARMDVSDVWVEDAAVAATTLLYSAASLGLGACWIQVRERYTAADEPAALLVRQVLGLPAEVEPLAIVAVGYPKEEPRPRERDLAWEKIHLNGWESPADGGEELRERGAESEKQP